MMTSVVVLQIDEVVGLLENAGFVWALLLATWGVLSYSFLRRHRNGPKVGPTHQSGSTSFPLKPHMSEEDVFRILTTDRRIFRSSGFVRIRSLRVKLRVAWARSIR